jgi:hypothetical protein
MVGNALFFTVNGITLYEILLAGSLYPIEPGKLPKVTPSELNVSKYL